MSTINAVLSFLVNNNTPANNTANTPEKKIMKTIPAAPAVKNNPEASILLLAAKNTRQARAIAKLEANAEFDDACIAQQDAEIAKLRAQVAKLEALQTVILRANDKSQRDLRNAEFQCQNLNTLANNNAAKANKLTADLDQANYVSSMNFKTAKKYAALAETYKNIARSSKGRATSKFALPAIEGEVTSLEVSWHYRQALATELINDVQRRHYGGEEAEVVSRKLVGFGKDNVEGAYHCRSCRKVEAHRGHRNGHTSMSAREAFHYLNR